MWRFLQKNVQKDKEEKLTCKVKVTKDVMAGMLRDTKIILAVAAGKSE